MQCVTNFQFSTVEHSLNCIINRASTVKITLITDDVCHNANTGQTLSASEQLTCSFPGMSVGFRTQDHWERSIVSLISSAQAVKFLIPVNKLSILLYLISRNTYRRQTMVGGFRACIIPNQGL